MSLFSVFDPVTIFGISGNWLILVMVVVVLPLGYYVVDGGFRVLFCWVIEFVGMVFKEISFPFFVGLVAFSISLFLYVGLENGVGLFPFVFTGTSHLMITFSLGFVLWMSSFLMGWMSDFEKNSAHLVPEGSPLILSPFMVIVELISQLIRPVTLSVRLAANMVAGHLIIGLIASISLFSFHGFIISIFLQTIMLVLEVAVALIQAFVFSVLVMLYFLEGY